MCGALLELPRKSSQIAPAFSTSRGALYQTDCFDLLASLKDDTVSTVFADPPFNLSKDYGRGKESDELGRQEYLQWCRRWMDELIRIVMPGGAIFIYDLPQ